MKIVSKRGRQLKGNQPDSTFTKEQQLVIQLCKDDPVHFINTFIKIENPSQGSIPFKLYDYQEHYVQYLHNNDQVVAVMPRQAGTTSVNVAFLIWKALFHPNQVIAIGGVSMHGAQNLCRYVDHMVLSVPAWLRSTIIRISTGLVANIQFNNGSSISIGITSVGMVQGKKLSHVYLDNFAYSAPRVQHDTFVTLIPTLVANGSVSIASAPNGVSNMFAKIFHDAVNHQPLPGFSPFRKTVHDMKQFDSQWKTNMKQIMGSTAWGRDFECEFK